MTITGRGPQFVAARGNKKCEESTSYLRPIFGDKLKYSEFFLGLCVYKTSEEVIDPSPTQVLYRPEQLRAQW